MSAMDAKVLRRAAELIDQGWCQGQYAAMACGAEACGDHGSWNDPHAVAWCLEGATARAEHEMRHHIDYLGAKAISDTIGTALWPDFNDAPGRTADEVAAALRAAAAQCDGVSTEPKAKPS